MKPILLAVIIYSLMTNYGTQIPKTKETKTIIKPKSIRVYTGKASWYSNEYCRKFNPSCKTASGAIFNDKELTAACIFSIPLNTKLLVEYNDNKVVVKCTDRGSFGRKYNRILDLSKTAFSKLAPISKGVIKVKVILL